MKEIKEEEIQLEEMSAFFENRLRGYDAHMRNDIEGDAGFYAFTAAQLPMGREAKVLDLGCGTGLELEAFFPLNPDAEVTGVDLCRPMLDALRAKFPDKRLRLVCGSYFDADFPPEAYDAAVSVESLHHFPAEKKRALYRKLYGALKKEGYFVLTDYFAESEALEKEYFENLAALKRRQGLDDRQFYHYDTPLTVEHEAAILREAGFPDVRILGQWDATCTVYAGKTFAFYDTDDLKTEEIFLRLDHTCGAQPEKRWLPAYYFDICLPDGTKIGTCDLRIGHNGKTYVGGNIGYGVDAPFRGRHYAAKACALLFRQAKKHGMDHLIITCDPDNRASARTCLLAGGRYLETAPIPPDNEMYAEGKRRVMIYRFDL